MARPPRARSFLRVLRGLQDLDLHLLVAKQPPPAPCSTCCTGTAWSTAGRACSYLITTVPGRRPADAKHAAATLAPAPWADAARRGRHAIARGAAICVAPKIEFESGRAGS